MLYHVTISDRTITVELGDGGISIDGVRVDSAELKATGAARVHHLLESGVSHTVLAHSSTAGVWDLHIAGRRLTAEVVDERTRAIRSLTRTAAGQTGPKPVRAPMPGMVVRIEGVVGDRVAAGQGILIMEAMKMENELRAEASGVISRIHVAPGQAVEKGAVLIEFEVGDA